MMAIMLNHASSSSSTSSTWHLHCFWIQGTSHLHAALSNAFCLMSLGGATQRNILDQRASVHLDCVHLYICIFVYSVYHTHIGPMCTHRCKCTHRLRTGWVSAVPARCISVTLTAVDCNRNWIIRDQRLRYHRPTFGSTQFSVDLCSVTNAFWLEWFNWEWLNATVRVIK